MPEDQRTDPSVSPDDPAITPEQEPSVSGVPAGLQRRNLLWYIFIRMLLYLAGPMTYVDVMHGTLIDKLGASCTLANLPKAFHKLTHVLPIFMAWLIPYRRLVRRVVVLAFTMQGVMGRSSLLLWLFRPALLLRSRC